ncbi:unnamed protein product [Closterium sp. Yama58-4]|nr:unnamed protein product [Closterium sp. Yama58-4]
MLRKEVGLVRQAAKPFQPQRRARGVRVVGVVMAGVVAVLAAGVEELVAVVEVAGVVEAVGWAEEARVAVAVELVGVEALGWRLGVQLVAVEARGI